MRPSVYTVTGFTLALGFALAASGAKSADFTCVLTDRACTADCVETRVTFAIDPVQFVAPQDPNDPPRRQVTNVNMDDRRFTAQAILMDGGIMGFHEDAVELGSILLIVQPNGTARMTIQPENRQFAGQCTSID